MVPTHRATGLLHVSLLHGCSAGCTLWSSCVRNICPCFALLPHSSTCSCCYSPGTSTFTTEHPGRLCGGLSPLRVPSASTAFSQPCGWAVCHHLQRHHVCSPALIRGKMAALVWHSSTHFEALARLTDSYQPSSIWCAAHRVPGSPKLHHLQSTSFL